MDPILREELRECRNNELCESRVISIWEGKTFFQMDAYNDPQKYLNWLWSFEVLLFAPTMETLSPKANENSTVLAQTFFQVLVKRTIAFHKKTNLNSIDLANAFIEKTVIPRVIFTVENFSNNGGVQSGHNVTFLNVSIIQFKGKHIKRANSETLDVITFGFKDYK